MQRMLPVAACPMCQLLHCHAARNLLGWLILCDLQHEAERNAPHSCTQATACALIAVYFTTATCPSLILCRVWPLPNPGCDGPAGSPKALIARPSMPCQPQTLTGSGPFQILVVMGLLVRIIHWAPALAGLGVTVALIPISALVSWLLTSNRRAMFNVLLAEVAAIWAGLGVHVALVPISALVSRLMVGSLAMDGLRKCVLTWVCVPGRHPGPHPHLRTGELRLQSKLLLLATAAEVKCVVSSHPYTGKMA